MEDKRARKERYDDVIMEFKDISKYFGGVQALSNVSMSIRKSEVIALLGDNGAGKSTFLKILSGIYIPDKGDVYIDSQPVTIRNPRHAMSLGISMVYQDLAMTLCENLDTVYNMFLGRELRHKNGRIDYVRMEQTTAVAMEELGIQLPSLRMPIEKLSGGQRQAVAIARATLGTPRIVLLDEPLASLGHTQRRQVTKLVLRLKEKGYGVVVVSHDLLEVFEMSDRVVVFRLGEKVAEIERNEITHDGVVNEITGGIVQL